MKAVSHSFHVGMCVRLRTAWGLREARYFAVFCVIT